MANGTGKIIVQKPEKKR